MNFSGVDRASSSAHKGFPVWDDFWCRLEPNGVGKKDYVFCALLFLCFERGNDLVSTAGPSLALGAIAKQAFYQAPTGGVFRGIASAILRIFEGKPLDRQGCGLSALDFPLREWVAPNRGRRRQAHLRTYRPRQKSHTLRERHGEPTTTIGLMMDLRHHR